MCIIVAASSVEWLWVVLQVAIGLGMVIFVHELGHFAVAKMCGVKCEKFFVGFDIGGYKISRKWGETEYGIGILPLGGYVKMLGQDDNPANIAEQVRESQATGPEIRTKEITGPDGETYEVDSRSYLAKSVPQRMAIISAGVIMNVIFAVVFAVIAFGLGVPYSPCVVSQAVPGTPAWQVGLRAGDEIVQIGDIQNPSFSDLRGGVMLGDLDNGVKFQVRRKGSQETEEIILKPKRGSGLAKIGLLPPQSLRLFKEIPTSKNSPAGKAAEPFAGGDEIIAIDGQAVNDYSEFASLLVQRPDQPLEITVRRGGKTAEDNPFGPLIGGEETTISVAPRPMKRLGLVMEKGKIVAVEEGSEAARQGIQPGDFIDKVSHADDASHSDETPESELFWDPIVLPDRLRQMAEENRNIRLTLRRTAGASEGRPRTDPIVLPLRKVRWLESWQNPNSPTSVPALGLAYRVLNRVNAVLPDSPAERAGLQGGDVITRAEFLLPEGMKDPPELEPIDFGEEGQHNWPAFIDQLQRLPEQTKVRLTYRRAEQTANVEMVAETLDELFVPERGFHFEQIRRVRTAQTFGEQLQLGVQETRRSLGMVFRFLRKLGSRQIPLTALGGPVTIAKAAGYSAFEGPGKLLVFLTILSANLAVINFMPIPLLDGGHMVFLLWEGVRGRPASERFVVALHTVGFVLIITLMVFVLLLDFELFDRGL